MAVAAEKKAAADARAAAAGETEEEEAGNPKTATGKKAKTMKHGKKNTKFYLSSSGVKKSPRQNTKQARSEAFSTAQLEEIDNYLANEEPKDEGRDMGNDDDDMDI